MKATAWEACNVSLLEIPIMLFDCVSKIPSVYISRWDRSLGFIKTGF